MHFSAAVYSGLCASFASLFGKLSGLECNWIEDIRLRYTLKVICFCTMVLLNGMVWTFFVKALQSSKTAVEATAVSTATNYIISGALGFIAFGEISGLYWWFGISLVVTGVIVINGGETDQNSGEELNLDKKPALNPSKMKKWAEIIEKKILPPKPELSKVLPGLYVGNYRDSKDNAQLERHGITHIIAIHDAARKLHHDKHYLCVMASDTPDQNLSQYFPICNDFIHAARLRGGNVLIHCLAGMSRSVTVAVAYIMCVTDLSWKESLKVVRVGRSVANPNIGFQKQLQEFETFRLTEERKRLKERYPSLALIESDQEQCRISLLHYQSLLLSKDICEGNCPAGETCPTGLCRSPTTKRLIRRKSSTTSLRSTQSPRMLPPTPKPAGGADLTRSNVSINSYSPIPARRPGSGPAGLNSYTGPSYSFTRTQSRTDVTELPPGVSMEDVRKRRGNSAPGTPMVTPPVSPQHWPRRASTLMKKPPPNNPNPPAQKPPFNN